METTEKQFAQIVRDNRSTIYTVCYMFSKDADEVSDLFQEVLINLWKGFAAFEGKSDIRTWIYRVSLNTCISVDRKKKRHKTVPLSMSINLFEDNDADTRQVQLLYKKNQPPRTFRQGSCAALARKSELRRDWCGDGYIGKECFG